MPQLRRLLPHTELRGTAGNDGRSQQENSRSQPVCVACRHCRQSKVKCDGQRPYCARCQRCNRPCTYDRENSESSLQAVKRKYHGLLRQKAACSEIIKHLRSATPEASLKIVERLRAGQDAKEIAQEIETSDLLLQLRLVPETNLRYALPYSVQMPQYLVVSESPYLKAPFQPADETQSLPIHGTAAATTGLSRYLKPYHGATIYEPRLDNARPSFWTKVSQDDKLMEDLLAAYLTREYHLYPIFQKDYFLEDMKDGANECCSSLLVNVVLAYACCCSSRVPNQYAYWEPQGLLYKYLAEAKRILEVLVLKGQHRSLTTVQALMLMNVIYNICGLDLLGKDYSSRGLTIALELRLFDGNCHLVSSRLMMASNFTAWAIFNKDSFDAVQFLCKPRLMHAPMSPLPDPVLQPEWYGEIWLIYPLDRAITPSFYGFFFLALSRFRVITNSICQALCDEDVSMTFEQARVFHERLLAWYNSLPPTMAPAHIFLPSHFLLHFEYHTLILMLYYPFKDCLGDERVLAKAILESSRQDLDILIRVYYIRHSFEATDIYLLSVLAKLGFAYLENLEHNTVSHDDILQNREKFRSTMALVLQGLYSQGQHVNVTRIVYSLIKGRIPSSELRIMRHSDELLKRHQHDDDIEYIKGEIHASWSPSTLSIADSARTNSLSSMIMQDEVAVLAL